MASTSLAKTLPRSLPFALVAALALASAGCDDSAQMGVLEKEVTTLDGQVKKLEGERDKLAGRVETAERRLAGLQEDLLAVRKSAEAAAELARNATKAGGAPAATGTGLALAPGATKGDPKTAAAAQELAGLLSTDEGRAVFEASMRQIEQKREDERGARMAAGLVDAFAQKANLSAQQTESMRKIVGRSMTEMGAIWRGMRDGTVTPEKRTENMAKMEEIRKSTDEEVKSVLDGTQYDMYQQETARMRGFMGGGGGPGGGGFGGGRGQ
ncbi:MAG: hypothetical protein K8T90_18110 [Planctomycetes bacterium]|nr:hypothetical protein [Planctomycetota bacterium]